MEHLPSGSEDLWVWVLDARGTGEVTFGIPNGLLNSTICLEFLSLASTTAGRTRHLHYIPRRASLESLLTTTWKNRL